MSITQDETMRDHGVRLNVVSITVSDAVGTQGGYE
jgi:hypothetical protein